jgi:amino acid transporter
VKRVLRKKSIDHIVNELANSKDSLKKNLTVLDLTSFGIAAVIGAGIFSTIGKACFSGGPAVIFLFIFTAVASGFSALCYAEFASRVPASGSAYTYAYTSFGEIFAWIIGWALIMEYSIGNIAVSISWSEYFVSLLRNVGIHFPAWLSIDYKTAYRSFSEGLVHPYTDAWTSAPLIMGKKIVFNLPALAINVIITAIVYLGIKESKLVGNAMVLLKILVILMVISVGFFYVDTANWNPFMPNKVYGVMASVSAVFFAYIGFDAISTTAEECINPKRDLPRGMIYSLIICTVLYILLALVLTGMVSYKFLDVKDPLAFVFNQRGLNWIGGVISVSAIVAMTSVLLVFQMGQPRIWLAMSRDGLMPKRFSKVHSKYQTPSFSTIITGVVVGVPILFLDYDIVIEFTSISTLFAFVLVSGGVLLLPDAVKEKNKFSLPKINSRYILTAIFIMIVVGLNYYEPSYFSNLANYAPADKAFEWFGTTIFHYSDDNVQKVSLQIFYLIFTFFVGLSIWKNLSLIPVLGVLSCMYLLTSMNIHNWIYFMVWMVIGLVAYFSYGIKKSKLNPKNQIN